MPDYVTTRHLDMGARPVSGTTVKLKSARTENVRVGTPGKQLKSEASLLGIPFSETTNVSDILTTGS